MRSCLLPHPDAAADQRESDYQTGRMKEAASFGKPSKLGDCQCPAGVIATEFWQIMPDAQ